MKKFLKIFFISLGCVVSMALLVGLVFWKEQTTSILNYIVDFINKPLPIVGVSLTVILIFTYKCVVGIKFGKKSIDEYKDDLKKTKEEIEKEKLDIEEFKNFIEMKLKEEDLNIEEIKQYLSYLYEHSRNKSIQEHGKGLNDYGEKQ